MTNLNHEHLEKIHSAILSKAILKDRIDQRGNIIRDHKTELDAYCKHETDNILPSVDHNHFEAHRKLSEHLQKDYIPLINKVSNPNDTITVELIEVNNIKPIKQSPIVSFLKVLNIL